MAISDQPFVHPAAPVADPRLATVARRLQGSIGTALESRRPVEQSRVVRFVIIGLLNTGFAYGCFAALYLLMQGWPYMAILVISREISVVFAYILYRKFVFTVRGPMLGEFARFWLVYAGSLVLNLIALPIAVEVLRLPVLLAQAVVTALAIASSWFGHSRFSFRSRQIAKSTTSP